jgi:hypothetical protein
MRRCLEAALIVVVMLCVPALTRVSQRLDLIGAVPQASGLSRNCDAPPERTRSAVPSSLSIIAPAVIVTLAEASDQRSDGPIAPAAPPPVSAVVSPPDSLRAPPRSRV